MLRYVCLAPILVAGGVTLASANTGPSFSDLLARAHAEADAGHYLAPAGDNVLDTSTAMVNVLSQANAEQLADFGALLKRERAVASSTLTARTTPADRRFAAGSPATMASAEVSKPGATLSQADDGAALTQAQAAGAAGSQPDRIGELIARAEYQVVQGHAWQPVNDSAVSTLTGVVRLLQNASLAEARQFDDLPAQFRARARQAEDAGQRQQADDFRTLASTLSDPVPPAPGTMAGGSADPTAAVAAAGTSQAAPAATADAGTTPAATRLPVAAPPRSASGAAKSHARFATAGPQRGRRDDVVVSRPPAARIRHAEQETPMEADPRCRAIVEKVQLGELPSDDDRVYLRHGCRQG